jgi:hypothetical protein
MAARSDAFRREQDVDSAARPEVEDHLSLSQLRDGQRIAAAEAREHCCFGELSPKLGIVEDRTERLRPGLTTATVLGTTRLASATQARRGIECGGPIAVSDFVLEILHRRSSMMLY